MAGYGKNDTPVGGYGPNDVPVGGGYGENDIPVEDASTVAPTTTKQNSGLISDLSTSFKRGVETLPGAATGLADIPFALAFNSRPFSSAADAAGRATGFQPGQMAKDAEAEYSPQYNAAQERVNQAWAPVDAVSKDPNAKAMDYIKAGMEAAPDINRELLNNPGYTLNQVVGSIPSMLAGGVGSKALMGVGKGAALAEGAAGPALPGMLERVAGNWAAPIAGGVGEGAVQAGQQMQQYDGPDQRKNAIAALGSGALDAVIAAGGGRLANKMGLETPETLMAKLGSQNLERAAALPLRVAGGAISEGLLQETPQSAQEQAWSNYVEGKPLMSGVIRQAVEGGISGAVMGAGANMSTRVEQQPPPGPVTRAAVAGVASGAIANAPDAPAANAPVMTPEDLTAAAQRRMESIVAKLNGTPDTAAVDPVAGRQVVIPGQQPQIVTPAEKAELQFLTENAANPHALAQAYGVQLAKDVAPDPQELAGQIPAGIGNTRSNAEAADPAIAEQQRLIDELNARLPVVDNARDTNPVVDNETGFDATQTPEQPKFSRANPLDDGAHNAATSPLNSLSEPTQGQKEAGNYTMGRAKVAGLDVSIENPHGSVRSSAPDAAEPWQTTMQDHYGYIKGVPARAPDKAHVDTFIKPGTDERYDGDVYVVNQNDPKTGKFDEPKVMMGYDSAQEAKDAYMRNYTHGWQGFGSIAQVPMPKFKEMLQDDKAFLHPVQQEEAPIPYEAPRFLRDTYQRAKDTVEYSPLPMPPQSKNLEKEAHARIDREGDAMVNRYIERFGHVVDPDQAKLMFSEFELNPELASAFHEPSSRLAKMVYAKLLATRPGKTVLFSAGGGGSGKSAALDQISAIDPNIADSTIFDGTLSSFKSSKQKIDTALAAGAPVRIVYTNREVGQALNGAMERSRVVPIEALIDAHVGASDTIRRLAKEYAGNPNVDIQVVNNNGSTIEEVAYGKLDDVPAYSYDEVKGRLYDQAKRALDEGRIDQRKYDHLVRRATQGSARGNEAAQPGQVAGPTGARAGEAAAQGEVAPKFARKEGGTKKPLFHRITETGHRREGSTGRYVGAPDWIGNSPVQLGLLRKKLRQLTLEGESGRYWYEKSSKAVMDLVGGDKVDAEKFVGLLAIYSQGTEVSVNLGFALEAYYQWKAGLPIDTGRFPTAQTKKADNWLKDGKDWGGIKTNNFYADLMEEIDPSKFDEDHATMDMWMAIAFDYGMKVLDQGPKYNFAKRETARLAKELGWKPHQVQAAIWTAIKARTETSEKERNAAEIKAGIATKNGNAHAIIKGKEYEHFRTAHKFAMDKQITPKEIADRGVDFADALKARAVQMSWEATPGVTTGVLPGIHNATTAQLSEYLVAVDKALHGDDGRDLIAELINLHNPPTLLGFSAWQGKIGAGAQSFFPVPVTGQGKDRAVLPVARDLLNKYAALKGYILSQEAVVWHHAVHGDAKSRNNGFDLATQRPLTEDEMRTLYDAARTYFSTDELAPAYTANGARILNFVDGLENKDFQKGMTKIYASLPEGFGGGIVDAGFFRSDGDYISNDWKENPNGEAYVATFAAGSPDLLGRADDLRAMVAQVNQDFSDRYGWGKPSFSRSDAASNRRAGEAGAGTGYGTAQENSVQVNGVHYSGRWVGTLDSSFYGNGMPGAEARRLDDWSAIPEQKHRIYFYVDTGKGVDPESGVGNVPHYVTLNNLYDWAADPLGFWADSRAKGGSSNDIINRVEQAIMAAGFDGLYDPESGIGEQGVAVLLGKRRVETAEQPKMSRKTETEAFKKWFGNSKVVDENGGPRVMYHSTVADFDKFRRARNDVGIHFGTQGQAEDRFALKIARDPYGPQVRGVTHATMPVYLSIKNPIRLNDAGAWNAENLKFQLLKLFPQDKDIIGSEWTKSGLKTPTDIRKYLQSKGYDGIVYANTGETGGAAPYREAQDRAWLKVSQVFPGKNGFTVEDQQHPAYQEMAAAEAEYRAYREQHAEDSYIAFEPTQIKSAIGNDGSFNPKNPDIRFSRGDGKTGNVATPADAKASKAISVLNTGMARYLKDTAWENAYAPGELHDTLSAIGEALEVGFGTRVIPIAPTSKRFDVFNGVHFAGNIYVNTEANVGFANIAGHELFHELKRKRPDLFQWFAEQSRQYYKDFDAYQKKLNSLLQDGEATIDRDAAEEELLSDFAGDSLADPKFLQGLADASPTKFRQLLMAVRAWIDGAIAKLKGNKSERYVTDLQAMRDNLSKALVAFAEGKPIATTKVAPSFTLKENQTRGGGVFNNIIVDSKVVGRIGGFDRGDFFELWNTRLDEHNGTGLYQAAVQQVADRYPNGLRSLEWQSSPWLIKALQKMPTFERDGDNLWVRPSQDIRFSQRSSGEFFSPLQRAFQNAKMKTMTGTGWAQWLQSNMAKVGVKKDEVTWSGINEYLELRGKDKISKEEVAGFLEQNGVQISDIVRGSEGKRALDVYIDETRAEYEAMSDQELWDEWNPNYSNPETREYNGSVPRDRMIDDLVGGAMDYFEGNPTDLEGGVSGTKYSDYVPPGGIDGTYREILVTLPNGAAKRRAAVQQALESGSDADVAALASSAAPDGPVFSSTHWSGTPNVLVHLRVDEVKGDGNKRLMRVIEVQSDWGQEGKREGFKNPANEARVEELRKRDKEIRRELEGIFNSHPDALVIGELPKSVQPRVQALYDERRSVTNEIDRIDINGLNNVPAAPFVTDTKAWVALGIKRAIQQAVSNNVDGIVFATGQENADLYDLSKQVDKVRIRKMFGGEGWFVEAYQGGEEVVSKQAASDRELADIVGKELADKAANEMARPGTKEFSGVDLKVGGEGMRAFYDQIVPSVAKDVMRQLGMPTTLVGRTQLPGDQRAMATTTGGKWGVSTKDGYVDSTRFDTQAEARDAAAEYNRTHGRVMIELTPALISTVNRDGIPLFSRANKQTYDIPDDTKLEAARRQVQDKFLRFQTIQEAIELTTAKDAGYTGKDINAARQYMLDHGVKNPITDATDVYQAETLSSSRIASRKQDFREDRIEPLLKKTAKAGVTMDEIADYLLASHAQEANARVRTIRQDPQATAFGMTDQQAAAALQSFRARPNFAQIDALANEWRQITEETKRMLVTGGIISQDMANAWDSTYSHYVPLKGVENQQGVGKGLSVNGNQKRRMGHGSREEAVIANILRDYERAVTQVEKNKVGMTLVRFALEISDDNIITLDRPVQRAVFKDGKAYEVLYHGSTVGVFSSDKDARHFIALDTVRSSRTANDYSVNVSTDPHVVMQASPMLADNEVNVYVAGQKVRVQINDELAAKAYTNMGVEGVNKILSGAREFNTWLSKAYTGYNPEFLLRNLFRDAIQGTVTLTGKFGIGTMAKIYSNYPAAMKELSKHYARHGSSQIVSEARADGMQIGSSYLSDLERIGDDVMTAYNEYAGMANTYQRVYAEQIAQGASKSKAQTIATMRSGIAGSKRIPIIGHFLSLMEHLNAVVENSLRLATYKTLRDLGYSRAQAAAAGKNLMNFNRKGEISNQAGALYLFFNPNMQGTHVMAQALVSSKYSRQAQALTGMMALAAFALAEMGRGGGDDDEDKWKKIPSYVRDRNMVIMVGDKQITIPVPYGFGVFHSLGNAVSDFVHGESGWKLGLRMVSAMANNFSPFGNPIANDNSFSALQLLPTIPKMALGPEANVNSFGAPIAPIKYSDSKPDSQNMFRSTKGTIYSALAEGMNDMTGGSKYQKGLVDVSPETLRFWVSSLTGGTGKFMVDTLNLGSVVAQGATPELREIPMARVLVREESINDVRRAYWDRVNEAKQAAEEFAAAKRAHDGMAMREIMNDNRPLIQLAKYSERQAKLIKAKRDLVDRIRQDESLSLSQKRDKIKQIEAAEENIYNKFISAFDDAKGE